MSPVLPPLNENFLVPDAIEFNMAVNATQPFYTFADSSGTRTITHLEFGRAAHRVAHLLRPSRTGVDGEVVALILQADTVLYHAIVAGLILAGYVPFPISHRNSSGAIIELLMKTSCRRLLTTHAYLKPLLESIKSEISGSPLADELKIEEIPLIASVYPYLAYETTEHLFKPYPPATKRPTKDDLCLYLHSSGSTGNPRPIPLTHLYWIHASLPDDLKCDNPRLTLGYMCMPPFHSYGIVIQLFLPVCEVLSVAVYPPTSALPEPLPPIVPSPDNILQHLKLTKSNVLVAPPTFYEIWALLPEAVEYLKTLKYVAYGGGPMALKMGNMLIEAGVVLHGMYGGTEFGPTTRYSPPDGKEPEDWEYLQLHDHINPRWMPQGDGSFELQLLSHKNHQPMIKNLPDVDGYATSDLWRPHPTKKGLWKIVGRIDDVIVHSSGEKTVPSPMEAVVVSNALVRGAVIFGRERDQTGILIEPKTEIDVEDQTQLASLRNQLWPTIEEANSIAPAHSRIFKEMILITSKGKPLPLTPKGTVTRKGAIKLYENEINAIYDNVKMAVGKSSFPTSLSTTDIYAWLLEQASDLIPGATINPVVDIFEQGFDSLCATFLRLRILNVLRCSNNSKHQEIAKSLSPNLVYTFPVIKDLAVFISSLLSSPKDFQPDVALQGAAAMEAMIAKYSFGFETPPVPVSQSSSMPSSAIVLLTGSTGNLGSHILAMLLEDSRVDKVYAYNRPSKAGTKTLFQRHTRRFEEAGLDVTLLKSDKLVLISGDAVESNLGLHEELYSLLCQTVNVVIHNAWRLDFNLSLASYEQNIKGTRHFIDLVRSGSNSSSSRFLFVSSIGAVQHWNKSKGAVPEDVIDDVSVALGSGYGEAKHVAERIVFQSGLQALSLRVGQIIGGRPKGVWPPTEWFPILVKSSISLGVIADASGTASWLGADTISATIVDLALCKPSKPFPRALNLVHPRPVQQSVIIRNIKKAIAEILGRDLKLVPFSQWFSILEERAEKATSSTWEDIPAIKLLEFFRSYANADANGSATQSEAGGLPILSTEKVQRISQFMRPEMLQQIGEDDAKLWVTYWHSIGYLN